ncbi:MAG: hypothetical protein M0029_13425 [Actinomycetota bacterium]|nr:hypothetical protein [Actinomycetota bacterium]
MEGAELLAGLVALGAPAADVRLTFVLALALLPLLVLAHDASSTIITANATIRPPSGRLWRPDHRPYE